MYTKKYYSDAVTLLAGAQGLLGRIRECSVEKNGP